MELRPLSRLLLVLTLAAISLPPAASAKSINKHAIRQQLEHKVFLLRGRYACVPRRNRANIGPSVVVEGGEKYLNVPVVVTPQGPFTCRLNFNSKGELQNQAAVAPFSLSAIYVDGIKLGRHDLTLHAYQVTILRLSKASPSQFRALPLDTQRLKIDIALDRSQPSKLQGALQTIFAGNIHQFLNSESPGKRKADIASLPLLTPETKAQANRELKTVGWPTKPALDIKPHNGVTPPTATYMPQPRFTDQARKHHVQGICEFSLVVNAQGFPQNIRILKTLPDGLEDRALVAISQYRFRPATLKGKPVAVRMIVVVDFHLT